jgi:hypothetical protein
MVATLSSIFTIFDGIARHILKNLSLCQIKVAEVSVSFNIKRSYKGKHYFLRKTKFLLEP